MSKIVVLGCGAVGKHMAIDLSKDSEMEVISVDVNPDILESLTQQHPIQIRVEDLSTEAGVLRAIDGADIVIGSVPYTIGYSMLERVIRAGKNIVDISYFPEDPFGLDELAKEMGVTAVVDCGVVPGMANIILGYHMQKMKVYRYECYVGGVPKAKDSPFGYKSPFPVHEVLEEYAETGSMVEDGKVVIKPMLSETMTIDIDSVGTLACLNSDGLRTLIQTADVPDMFEKTLRYPEHVDAMRHFHKAGLFSTTPIQVKGVSVRPIDLTSKLLTPLWEYRKGEADLTVMRLIIQGEIDGKGISFTYEMVDEYDSVSDTLSMARTTGYTCNAVARLVHNGTFSRKGICPPEFVGQVGECWGSVQKYLEDRTVFCQVQQS